MKAALALVGLLAAGAAVYLFFLAAPGPTVTAVPPTPEELGDPLPPAPPPPAAPARATAPSSPAARALPPAPKPPIASPPGAKELSLAIEEASRALPTTAQLRKLSPEAAHRTPAPVMKANAAIGQVAETLEREPGRAGEGLAFYGDCARRSAVATSVRALCLTKMRQLSQASGLPAVEDGIAVDVVQLSDMTMR